MFSTLVLQVCKLQQRLQITDTTFWSKVKVTYTVRKLLFNGLNKHFTFDSMVAYGV